MNDREIIDVLRDEIEGVLAECDASITPKVCELRSTPNGKGKIVDMIIHMILRDAHSIGSAIQSIERTFNDNLADD